MPKYRVPYVRRYLEPLWRQYRDCADPSDRVIEAAVHGLLNLSIILDADDEAAAVRLVENQFPGHVVMREGIERV